MALVPLLTDEQACARARAVFDDIRATRGSDYVNNIWRALANDPAQLESTWGEVKRVMAPGAIDALTKELVYIAVSAANNCSYCLQTHTASARAKGMSEAMFGELMQVVYDTNTNPVPNATVTGSWSGKVRGSSTGVTDLTGTVVLTSPKTSKTGLATFTVTGVTAPGYTYDPSQNLVTSVSATKRIRSH